MIRNTELHTMHHGFARFSFTFALAAVARGPALLAAESYEVKIENNVAVKMRDGVTCARTCTAPRPTANSR